MNQFGQFLFPCPWVYSAFILHCPIKLRLSPFTEMLILSIAFFGFRISMLCIFLEFPLLSWHFTPCGNSDLWVLSSLSLPLSIWALFLISPVNGGVPSGEKWHKRRSCPLSFLHFKSCSTSIFRQLLFAFQCLQTAVYLILFQSLCLLQVRGCLLEARSSDTYI